MTTRPFWETKSLDEMTLAEWESLCDGCGRCCLHKLEDEDTGRVHLTVVACRLLDVESARCTNYAERRTFVPECTLITPANAAALLLPHTCAYRVLREGRTLEPWHPLVSGTRESVHAAGVSVRGWAVSENEVPADDYEDYVVAWADADGSEG